MVAQRHLDRHVARHAGGTSWRTGRDRRLELVDAASAQLLEAVLPGLPLPPEIHAKSPAYLSRYTHRIAISNRRLVATDGRSVTFKVKDYRIEGPGRYKTMTLDAAEFIRRFLLHVLPKGFHRIRHYGLLASGVKADNLALARKLLDVVPPSPEPEQTADGPAERPCPCCGSPMRIIEVFEAGQTPRHRPGTSITVIRIDTS